MTDDPSKRRLQDPFNEGAQAAKARKMRSLAIAIGLILFVVLIFAVSVLKLSGNAQLVNQLAHAS